MLPTIEPVWRDRYKALFASADLFLCEGPFMAQSLVDFGMLAVQSSRSPLWHRSECNSICAPELAKRRAAESFADCCFSGEKGSSERDPGSRWVRRDRRSIDDHRRCIGTAISSRRKDKNITSAG